MFADSESDTSLIKPPKKDILAKINEFYSKKARVI
jgi:hypothetical protein